MRWDENNKVVERLLAKKSKFLPEWAAANLTCGKLPDPFGSEIWLTPPRDSKSGKEVLLSSKSPFLLKCHIIRASLDRCIGIVKFQSRLSLYRTYEAKAVEPYASIPMPFMPPTDSVAA